MNLRDIELTVLTQLRDGKQPSQIARDMQIGVQDVYLTVRHITNQWKTQAKEWIRFQAYNNHLRMELLWSLIVAKLAATSDDPDPKLLAVALNLIDKHNRMFEIGADKPDNTWLTRPAGALKGLEAAAADAGIDVPQRFSAPVTSVSATV